MPVLLDVAIPLTAEEVLRTHLGGSVPSPRSALHAISEEAVEMAKALVQPAAVYQEYSVVRISDDAVILRADSGLVQLTVGRHAGLLEPARLLVIAVWTIGSALEGCVRDRLAASDVLFAFMLDVAGTMCLGAVGKAVQAAAQERAAGLSWGVSAVLSPGSLVGWPVQGQRELCNLLSLGEIGVRLSEYCVLEPHKSASAVIGIGPNYDSVHTGSMCRYCAIAETCWLRQVDTSCTSPWP